MSDGDVIPCYPGIVWRDSLGIEHSVVAWEVKGLTLRAFVLGYDCSPYLIDNDSVEFGTFHDRSEG
jgi:hypothetical protein